MNPAFNPQDLIPMLPALILTLGATVLLLSEVFLSAGSSRGYQAIVAAVFAYPMLSGVEGDPLVAEALAVRSGQVHAERQFADADISAEAARDGLVQAALAVPVKVPNLEKAGLKLVAISAYPDKGGHEALQLSYRDRNGVLFTMYMRQTAGGDRFEMSARRNMQVCVWQNDALSVVMLGEMPAHEMLKVATATYADLNF